MGGLIKWIVFNVGGLFNRVVLITGWFYE